MTGLRGLALLMIVGWTTVSTLFGQGAAFYMYNLTTAEQNQMSNAREVAENVSASDAQALGTVILPNRHYSCWNRVSDCQCHAHGDVRYWTCDKKYFKYNTSPIDIGIMAKPIGSWFWYITTTQEYFDNILGQATRLSAVKFKCFIRYVIVDYKTTPAANGEYLITVGKEPNTMLFQTSVKLDGSTPASVLYSDLYFEVKLEYVNNDKPGYYITARCTLLNIKIFVARHCLQINIPRVWCQWLEGICGDYDGFDYTDKKIVENYPEATPKPFNRWPGY